MTVADVQQLTHDPDPSYDCRACGRRWPCDSAREQLTQIHAGDRVQLAIVMWDHLEDAARIQPVRPASELFARFLSWTGPS